MCSEEVDGNMFFTALLVSAQEIKPVHLNHWSFLSSLSGHQWSSALNSNYVEVESYFLELIFKAVVYKRGTGQHFVSHTLCWSPSSAWQSHSAHPGVWGQGLPAVPPCSKGLNLMFLWTQWWRGSRDVGISAGLSFWRQCLALSMRSHACWAMLEQLASHMLLVSHRWCRRWGADRAKK